MKALPSIRDTAGEPRRCTPAQSATSSAGRRRRESTMNARILPRRCRHTARTRLWGASWLNRFRTSAVPKGKRNKEFSLGRRVTP